MRRLFLLAALIAAPVFAGAARGAVTFDVLYDDAAGVGFKDATPVGDTTLGAIRKATFEEALSVWGHSLPGSNPVLVKTDWVHAGNPGAIAASGVGVQWANFPYAPKPDIAYAPALVSQFYGGYYSYNVNFPDILVQFNLDYSWYYATDGAAPAGQYDFYHAAMHEICHGLGFQSNIQPDGTFLDQFAHTVAPDSYSANITTNGTLLTALTPAQRKTAAFNGPLTFSGPKTLAATNGQGAALAVTAPNFTIGITASHLDQSYAGTFDNLMVPGQPSGPIYTGEGPITTAIMQDIGWADVKQPLVTTEPPLVGVPAWNKVTLRALVDPNGQTTTARFVVRANGGALQYYAAESLPADNESHEVSIVAPFDLNVSDRYTVQAIADYHHGYAIGEAVYPFVPLTPYAGAMLTFTGSKNMAATGMGIPTGAAPFTVEGWIYLDSLPGRETRVMSLGAPGAGLSLLVRPDGTLAARMPGAGDITPANPFVAGQWYQFSVVFDGSTLALYLKGQPAAAAAVAGHPAMDQLVIGGSNPDGFSFSMDEVRVWNLARSQTEIHNDYDRVGLTSGAGLVAAYGMNEATYIVVGTANTTRDGYLTDDTMWAPSTATIGYPVPNATYATQVSRTAATLNGIVDPMGLDTTVMMGWGDSIRDFMTPAAPSNIAGSSSPTPVSTRVTGLTPGRRYNFGPIATNAASDTILPGGTNQSSGYFVTPAGPAGTALSFAGNGDAVRVPNFAQNSFANGITIQFWQKVTEPRQQSTLVLTPDNVHDRINVHSPWSDGYVYFDFGDITNGGRLAYNPPDNIVGTWQHFTFVATPANPATGHPGSMEVYRNGHEDIFQTGVGTYTPQTGDLSIGGLPVGSFKGTLDELRIWDRPLTQTEIEANWNITLRGDEPDLVLYMPMDDASGDTVPDMSGHGNNGQFWSNGLSGGQQRWNPYYWEDPLWAVGDWAVNVPTVPTVTHLLRIAGGLESATPAEIQRYSADGQTITLNDAVNAARP